MGKYLWIGLACIAVLVSGCTDPVEKAKQQLAAQGIAFSDEAFFEQINKRNVPALDLFFQAGLTVAQKNKDGMPALLTALDGGNAEVVKLFLDKTPVAAGESAPVSVSDKTGRNALLLAAAKGDDALITALLSKGAYAVCYDGDQNTPLHLAALKGSITTADLLLKADIASNQEKQSRAINFRNNNSETPLMIATQKQNPDMVKLFLASGANPDLADRRSFTPLMAAAEKGNESIVKMLIDAKAKMDLYDIGGITPLKAAIKSNQQGAIKLLLESGADPDFVRDGDPYPIQLILETKPFNFELFTLLKSKSKKADTSNLALLINAVENNQPEVVKLLLEQGLDPNSKDSQGKMLLYRAIEKGYDNVAAQLIAKGADLKKAVGTVPILVLAVRNNLIQVVHTLLENGASVDVRNNEGVTLAEFAVYKGYPEILEMLLAKKADLSLDYSVLSSIRDGGGKAVPVLLNYGADPNVLSQDGDPALLLAVSANQEAAVKGLLEYKAFPNVMSERLGNTTLGIAAYIGNLKVVKMLVAAGTQVDLGDKYGVTPLGYAASQSRLDVVEFLLSKGADKTHADKLGRTVLDMAAASQVKTGEKEKVINLLSH